MEHFDLRLAAWQRKTEKLWLFLHVSSTPPRCKHVKKQLRATAESSYKLSQCQREAEHLDGWVHILLSFQKKQEGKVNKRRSVTNTTGAVAAERLRLVQRHNLHHCSLLPPPSSLRTSSHSHARLFSPVDMKICQTAQSAFYAMLVGSAARKHSEYSRDGSSQAAWAFLC